MPDINKLFSRKQKIGYILHAVVNVENKILQCKTL